MPSAVPVTHRNDGKYRAVRRTRLARDLARVGDIRDGLIELPSPRQGPSPTRRLFRRDRFIGWTAEARQRNLGMLVGNSRFLILPWARLPNLASHILALARRQLPSDWKQRYNVEPMLIETFVESERFSGGAYRAAGWIHVGATKGRGRNDTRKEQAEPKKDIWLRPLRKDWRRVLNRVEQK